MEDRILEILERYGPLTGSQLKKKIDVSDGFMLWKTCYQSSHIIIHKIGRRYLRLDKHLNGYFRLSPSIFREFLDYSVIGLVQDREKILEKALFISNHMEIISRYKSSLAYRLIKGIVENMAQGDILLERCCFMIAGDTVYNMAHDVPRPEKSTGILVRGSDIDLVVVGNEEISPGILKRLDDAILREKMNLLRNPHIREELDYVVKDMEKVHLQLRCKNFSDLVACKILYEAEFLYGSNDLFYSIKRLLKQKGLIQRFKEMEEKAEKRRKDYERLLLKGEGGEMTSECIHMFYPSEELEEFEY